MSTVHIGAQFLALSAGMSSVKASVRVVSTTNRALSGLGVVDGVTIASGDRVLLAGQTDAAANGIYVAVPGAWWRAPDLDNDRFASLGMTVYVREGTAGRSLWALTSPSTGMIELGSTALTFTKVLSLAPYALPAEAFSSLLVLDTPAQQTFSGSGAFILALANSGHVEGVTKTVIIPANTATELRIAPDLNTDLWEPFVASEGYAIVVTCVGVVAGQAQFVSTGKKLGLRDTVAPTIVSATVNTAAPTSLVVIFNKPVYLPTIAGLDTVFTVGTDRSITGVVSGNGTTTVTFSLSGNVSGSDDLDLVISADRTLQSMDGVLVATGSTPVTVVSAWDTGDLTNLRLWINPGTGHATSEGAGVASVTNQGSLGGTFTQGTGANQPVYNANGFGAGLPWFSYDGTNDSLVSTITFDDCVTDPGEWYFGAVVAIDAINTDAGSDANEAILSESAGYWSSMFRSSNGFNGYVWDGGAKLAAAAVGAPPVAKALVEFRSTGGNIHVRVNKGAETTVAAGDVQIVNGTLRIGADRSAVNFLDFKHGEMWLTDGDPGVTQRNAQADAMIAKYSIP